jgi:hypothetical protein
MRTSSRRRSGRSAWNARSAEALPGLDARDPRPGEREADDLADVRVVVGDEDGGGAAHEA